MHLPIIFGLQPAIVFGGVLAGTQGSWSCAALAAVGALLIAGMTMLLTMDGLDAKGIKP